jgi:hypothetical protein
MFACNDPVKTEWLKAEASNNMDTIKQFYQQYKDHETWGKKAFEALEQLSWAEAAESKTVYNYLKYATDFPEGPHVSEAVELVQQIPFDSISWEQLSSAPFVGSADMNGQNQLVTLFFIEQESHGDTIYFKGNVNSGKWKKEVKGQVIKSQSSLSVEPIKEADISFILTPGRLYAKNGKLFAESTDVLQYWKLKQ